MTRLILVRHGQSQANQKRNFAGQTDSPLTDLGKEQALLTAEYIAKNYKVDVVYASDLQRAYYTGQRIAEKCGVPIIKRQGLREIFVGEWENKGVKELLEREDYLVWLTDIYEAKPENGETCKDFADRILKNLNQIAIENPNKTVVVATHATPIRVLESKIKFNDIKAMQELPWVSNASCSIFNYENGEWAIEKMDICEHMKDKITRIMDPRKTLQEKK